MENNQDIVGSSLPKRVADETLFVAAALDAESCEIHPLQTISSRAAAVLSYYTDV